MSKKIFRSLIAVAMIVLLTSLVFTSGFIYDYYNKSQTDRLKAELSLATTGVEQFGASYFYNYNSNLFRFTLIAPEGEVLYDSAVDIAEMENHSNRKEVKQALQSGSGSSARYSSTLTERTFYEAILLQSGDILRISTTQITVATLIIAMLPAISAIIIFAVILAVVISQKVAKNIVKPLENLDLEHPENNDTYEELTPLLSMLVKQHRQIEHQMRKLKRKSDEFEQITDSLSEGMILLDKSGNVITLNTAAKNLFKPDIEIIGNSFLTVDRSISMSKAVNKALAGEHSEFREERSGQEFQFMITPIKSSGKILGAVILCINVTETVFAERNRKEFTANVSHELKTPLQSIIGSAELLENGLVKKEDNEKFIGNIKNEAQRLVSLINDIIRLSQLDEEIELPIETVDLYSEATEVAQILENSASKKQVEIEVCGENCVINGVRRYIYEIIYNLCDNAIRYNKQGGKVKIKITHTDGKPTLTVSDSGIGIPIEHQSRIFERFYRVDKSHSKETGGTGLGLSIVKHAVVCQGGTISLNSTVGVGTEITVKFN